MFYVVAYDIKDSKRRVKIASILEGYGIRVNYSVFELKINKKDLFELLKKLVLEVNKKEDSIRFYNLTQKEIKNSFEICKNIDVFSF